MSSRPSTPAPERRRFPRSQRLTRDSELQEVRAHGKRFRTERLEVRFVASPFRHARVGIIVPKGKETSVARNLVKRRLREIFRQDVLLTLPPLDVVVRARPSAFRASFDELLSECAQVLSALKASWVR